MLIAHSSALTVVPVQGKARFRKPVDISGDCRSSVSCDLYVTDSDDHRLRKLFMDDRELYIADTVLPPTASTLHNRQL